MLCTLWKGLGAGGDGNFGIVNCYGRCNSRTVYSYTSKPSQLWRHQQQPAYVRICECGLFICYDCPAVGQLPQSTDVNSYFQEQATCLWHTAQIEPRHPRQGTGLHHAATPNLCRQRGVLPDAPNTDVSVYGLHVSWNTVMRLLSELDPVTSASHRTRAFTRRVYYCMGPNQVTTWDGDLLMYSPL